MPGLTYLLDTNTAGYPMEQRPTIVAKIKDVGGPTNLAVTTITVAELRYGVGSMPEGRRRRDRVASLDTVFFEGTEVRPFDQDAAAVFGWAGALLKEAGVAFNFQDLAIASVALAEDLTLVSNDGFFAHAKRRCGLKFERWKP